MTSSSSGPQTAITTWSGFIYQGKVAIYHVLELLKAQGECSSHDLQLDSLEDFTILKNSVVESMHQVKALKSQNYSTYKDALEKLARKTISEGCNKAYFHVAKEIAGKSTMEIETVHHPVAIYQYDTAHWCHVDEIDLRIEEKIKELLVSLWPGNTSKHSDEYVSKARAYLDQIVLKQVLKIHGIVHANLMSDRQAAYRQTVPFSEFSLVLKDDLDKPVGEDYYFYVLLDDFHSYYQDYCIQNENELTEPDKIKLSWCMLQVENFNRTELKKFVKNIIPHRKFKFESLKDYKDNTFNGDEIKSAFFRILNSLRKPAISQNGLIQWHKGNSSFSPTTILHGAEHKTEICERILKNALGSDLEVLFERNNLITTSIEAPSITECVPDVMQMTEEESEFKIKDRLLEWKTVSLISLSNAKEQLNA